ncbi:50S ribosomal protein L11 methyltransferase [Paraflavitalea pollutisoli]|uniref:50S ribosomal protein L11 methyltransferase n=1 Tax=Paraflavitalea pollutisoli TaxID=3034143 RepID=UPI0023EBDF71|nr:50S ribosomal protein L11 methyltransferase [Paraflavitalea sp. H1-2-19X]
MSTKANYTHVRFHPVTKEQQEILIALLNEQGFEGFEEGPQYLSAFIPEEQLDEAALVELAESMTVTYSSETIAQRNWNEEWEKNFEPVVVDKFCAVRAHFHAPVADVQYEIIITPKMSFGTGHHSTTYMMMQYMEHLDLVGKSVLDFGTGTGILAVLAEQQGASTVMAIDNDDWSIDNAAENIAVNGATKIVLEKADSLEKYGRFNIILANINKHVLLANMASLQQHLTPGGVIIMSGLLAGDRSDILHSASTNGIQFVDEKQHQAWIALQFTTQ